MKKLFVSILALLYITTSSGAVVHLHYCMDKLVGWGLWNEQKTTGKCGKCGMSKTGKQKSCCKDEQKLVKIEKDQRAAETVFNLSLPVVAIIPFCTITADLSYYISPLYQYPCVNAPPGTALNKTFLLNCNFRI